MNYTRTYGVTVRVGDLGLIGIDRHHGNLIRRYRWAARRVGAEAEFGWSFTLEGALGQLWKRSSGWAFEQFLEDFELDSTDLVSEHMNLLPIYCSTLKEVAAEISAMRATLGRKNKGGTK